MIVYGESSAVLAWLLGEERGIEVGEAMSEARGIVASDLTLLECERALIRAWSVGDLSETERVDQSSALSRVATHWTLLTVGDDVLARARRPFPIEPVRALDAVHLASALVARGASPGLRLLSLDQRIRENAVRLGFDVLP